MRVTLELFAMLGSHLSSDLEVQRRAGNEWAVDVPEGTSVQQVIDRLGLPSRLVHLVVVNAVHIPLEACGGHVLNADDQIAIWPPIDGG